MRLTIEPTEATKDHAKIIIEVEADHLMFDTVLEDLIVPAMWAWGFGFSTIKERIDIEER